MYFQNKKTGTLTSPYYIALTTCPNSTIATELAETCVEKKLAACVNIIPSIQSIYQWQGKIEHDTESLLIIKTTKDKLETLDTFIQKQHPYDIPEFITFNIESGSQNYFDWIRQSIK